LTDTPELTRAEGPGLPTVVGHEDLRGRLRDAASSRRMPQSLLLHGPPGVGKRTLALWTAALLQCESPDPPCRSCRSCRLAARLEHPDTHYHFPLPRPKGASTRRKLRDMLEAARMERLAVLREGETSQSEDDQVTGIYLAAVEEIRAQAARRPAMGPSAVFVISEADRMVPQSANPEAANAFLKLLEEPPGYAYVILTSSRPSALLPTIRSRVTSLRVAPLSKHEVADHLLESRGVGREEAEAAARRAQGSIGYALALLSGHGDEAREGADRLLRAAALGGDGDRLRAALAFTARGARSVLVDVLDALEERLRDLLCVSSGAGERALAPQDVDRLLRAPPDPARVQEALGIVERAREDANRNVNPQATVALLLGDLAGALGREEAGRPSGV
jgi:DNA polymerase-3 subunit delta'